MSKFKIPALPEYRTTLPSLKKEISFRPFTVAEEKILMIAKEAEPETRTQQIEDSMLQVLSSCVLSKDVDVRQLSSIDVEWILLQLRIKSIGPFVDLYFNCTNSVDGKRCRGRIDASINLEDVKVNTPEVKNSLTFDFNGKNYILEFKPLSIDLIKESERFIAKRADLSNEKDLVVLYNMIDKIYDDTELFTKDDISIEEFQQFIGIFTPIQRQKLQDFFSEVPHLEYELDLTCPVCGNHSKYELNKLDDFF